MPAFLSTPRGPAILAIPMLLLSAAPLPALAQQPTGNPTISGGFGEANESAPGYAEARALALRELKKKAPRRAKVETISSEVQVVAGLNYRFEIGLSNGQRWEVVVFRNLQGRQSVSRIGKLQAAE
jgi:hypothetical protein